MFGPSPILLWRFMLGELLRLLAVTTMSLVVVLAFAAAVKPLADGQVELSGALLVMGLAIVPMLQFALPFAAGFAATLGYHRFGADNEYTAASAGGMSHRTILVPALVCGVLVCGAMAYLLNETVPGFLRSMERVITRDVTQLVKANIERGESVRLGPFDLHANAVVELEPSPESGALNHLVLSNVLAVQADRLGRVSKYSSAERVDVWLFEDADDPQSTIIQFAFRGAIARGESDLLGRQNFATKRLRIAGSFHEDPKFLRFNELRRAYKHPEEISKIDTIRRNLVAHASANESVITFAQRLRSGDRIQFTRGGGSGGTDGARSAQDTFVISGGRDLVPTDDGWRIVPREDLGQIRVDISLGGDVRQHLADEAILRVDAGRAGPVGPQPTLSFVLELVRLSTIDQTGVGPHGERLGTNYGELQPVGANAKPWLSMSVEDLAAEARLLAEQPLTNAPVLNRLADRLLEKSGDMRQEILSKQHERAAFAVSGLIMVLVGSVIGLRLRESLPLPVYLWSFFPALMATVTISAGRGIVHSRGAEGLALLWGGVLLLAVYTVYQYAQLRRH